VENYVNFFEFLLLLHFVSFIVHFFC